MPIVARELRVAARRKGTFKARTVVALGAIAVGLLLYIGSDAPAEITSKRIFIGLQVLTMLFCLMAGRGATADCLSEEKREGTLGLLFLTDLKGYDIVLGKLAATSLNGFYCLLAVFPVMAVPLLMGGITNGEFWRAVLALANTFVFSLSVGMVASAFSRDARRAMGANLLLLLLIAAIPGAAASAAAFFLPTHPFYSELMFSCPPYLLYLCDDSNYKFHRPDFWCSVGVIHFITWLLLGIASFAVPRMWQERSRVQARGPTHVESENRAGSPDRRHRRRLLDINAFYWLAARSRFKPLQVWALLLFIAGWWLFAMFQFGSLWLSESSSGTNIATAIMINVGLKLWIALEASRPLAENRKSGGFELLLSTPLTVGDILRGQWLALKRQFLLPTVAGLVAMVIFMASAWNHSSENHDVILIGWLGAILMFIVDVAALIYVGIYCGLVGNNPNHATVLVISRIIIAPAAVFGAFVILSNVQRIASGAPGPPFIVYVCFWFLLGLATDLFYAIPARRKLHTQFRRLAGQEPRKRA